MQLPARSTLAGGLTAVIGWGIVTFALPALGLAVEGPEGLSYLLLGHVFSAKDMLEGVTACVVAVFNYMPDSLKDHAKALNVDVQKLASIIPTTEDSYPEDYKNLGTIQNINKSGR